MTWYTASLIIAIVPDVSVPPGSVGVFEDFFLIEASSQQLALAEANRIGKILAAVQDGLTVSGAPARRMYLGVRKLRSIYNNSDDIDQLKPTNGSELSHQYFEVSDLDTARKLALGERVVVEYVDDAG